jgi:hypothetical protein
VAFAVARGSRAKRIKRLVAAAGFGGRLSSTPTSPPSTADALKASSHRKPDAPIRLRALRW